MTNRPEIIPGERVFLSHLTRDDVPEFSRWFANLETTQLLGWPGRIFLPEQEHEWYDNYVKFSERERTYAIVARDQQRLIGNVSLTGISHINNRAELGVVLSPDATGRGYGREAIRLMCDYGFTFLNLHVIYLWYVSYNVRARKSYDAVGFRETGRIPGARLLNGTRYDDVLMAVTRTEFGDSQFHLKFGILPI
jgi:RimJ/RimL family protein N-acetyltransferase